MSNVKTKVNKHPGCIPLGGSGSGFLIRDHLDHGAPKKQRYGAWDQLPWQQVRNSSTYQWTRRNASWKWNSTELMATACCAAVRLGARGWLHPCSKHLFLCWQTVTERKSDVWIGSDFEHIIPCTVFGLSESFSNIKDNNFWKKKGWIPLLNTTKCESTSKSEHWTDPFRGKTAVHSDYFGSFAKGLRTRSLLRWSATRSLRSVIWWILFQSGFEIQRFGKGFAWKEHYRSEIQIFPKERTLRWDTF